MPTKEDLELVTRVGPGTPMGEMLRRYWVPAMLAEELPEPDCPPKPLRLLGEDLVAFRDTDGRVGIMDVHCPHRLASLALGRNEEGGLRCLYHGWKIDIEGKILETPCELPTSRVKDSVLHKAYLAKEAADLIWVYMGPREAIPEFPDFNWMRLPAARRTICKMWEKCNFIQGMEGVFDTYHTNLLHSGYEVMHWTPEQIAQVWKRPSRATHGPIHYERTAYGFHYAARREPATDPDRYEYIRVTEYVSPFYCIPPAELGSRSAGYFFVPMDDYNTMLHQVIANETTETPVDRDKVRHQMSMMPGEDLDEHFRPWRNASNNFGQNRQLMSAGVAPSAGTDLLAVRSAYSGIDGGPQTQDMAMVETMGPIADRSKEHLGASDMGIVQWRNSLIESVKEFLEGASPPALNPPVPYHQVYAVSALVEKGADWHDVLWTNRDDG